MQLGEVKCGPAVKGSSAAADNLRRAMDVAERQFGVPQLLDATEVAGSSRRRAGRHALRSTQRCAQPTALTSTA